MNAPRARTAVTRGAGCVLELGAEMACGARKLGWQLAALTLVAGIQGCVEPAEEWRIRRDRYPNAYVPDEALSEVCGDPDRSLLELSPYVNRVSRERRAADAGGSLRAEYTGFDSAAAALDSVTGTWVLCEAQQRPGHAGVQLLPGGRWRALTVEDGRLVAGAGFGQEGPLRVVESSGEQGRAFPGSYQLELLPYGLGATPETQELRRIQGGPLVSERSLEIESGTLYLRGELPVVEPEAAYAEGERAGSAGCDARERGIVSTELEAAALLSGSFALCSGVLLDGPAQLFFDGSRVELRRDGGSVLAGSVSLSDASSGLLTIQLPEQVFAGRTWQMVMSRAPLKLWVVDPYRVGRALAETAIFSALP